MPDFNYDHKWTAIESTQREAETALGPVHQLYRERLLCINVISYIDPYNRGAAIKFDMKLPNMQGPDLKK